MTRGHIDGLYYITHVDNVPSILKRGILSHERVEKEEIEYTPIYDRGIVLKRGSKLTPDGRTLWSFANLFFQPRNPMLYRVICERSADEIAVLAVRPVILNRRDIFISTGNAAHSQSSILPRDEGLKAIPEIREDLDRIWWSPLDGSKRRIMAECLVPDEVPPELIQAIYVPSHEASARMKEMLQQPSIQIVPEPRTFFKPRIATTLTPNLTLVEGDMFFSRLHTLTVSVNCVGVMGKGLASTAKYRFPDVYVRYQDLCRERKLRMGKPYLYKRETSFDYDLADEPLTLSRANSETWFLLFPTKRHWREWADIRGIEKGLRWLEDNYKTQGIQSLAIPALGCGLGRLKWRDVGPLLCKYLSTLKTKVWLYLPAEKEVPAEFLSKNFLLP